MSDFVLRLSIIGGQQTAPDPAAARADEAAALADIDARLDPVSRAAIMPILKGEIHDGYGREVRGKTAEWRDRFARFQAARAHRFDEERREASVKAAYKRGGVYVVAVLGDVPSGTLAIVLRRVTLPPDIIVLGPASTPETFGGALAALDQSRKLEGDDLVNDITIDITDVRVTSVDVAYQAHLETLVAQLRDAPMREIDGVGKVRAIGLYSLGLQFGFRADP